MLSTFPHLTTSEFDEACSSLIARFSQRDHEQDEWQAVEIICQYETRYLRVKKTLPNATPTARGASDEDEDDELDEDDDEALETCAETQTLIHYDIFLSPVYRTPVLYINISDPQHRYSPTMATLYSHLIPSYFKAQAENGGVIGGVSITVSKRTT